MRIKSMSPQFLVKDIENSIAFYTQKLGFDLAFRHEDFYAGVITNGCAIHLKSGNPSVEERKRKKKTRTLTLSFQ